MRPTRCATLGLVEIGGGDEDRHLPAAELYEDSPEIAARNGIDAVGRLVEKEHFGRVDQRAGQTELLFHAAGELAGQAASWKASRLLKRGAWSIWLAVSSRHAEQVRVEVDVLRRR